MTKTVEAVLEPVMAQWLKRQPAKRTRPLFKKWVKEQVMKAGLMPVAAVYAEKKCTICGKDDLCPGWHTPDDKRIAEKVLVKQTDGLPGFEPPTKAKEQLSLI